MNSFLKSTLFYLIILFIGVFGSLLLLLCIVMSYQQKKLVKKTTVVRIHNPKTETGQPEQKKELEPTSKPYVNDHDQ